MTSTARVWLAWILFVVNSAMAIGADATGEFTPTPAAVTSRDTVMVWLEITLVPLIVFLIGACLWGCIQNSGWWRSFMEIIACGRRGVSVASEADAIQLGAGLPNTSSQHELDLEEGNAASHHAMGDNPTIATGAGEMMQQPPLQSANDGGILPAL